MRNAVAAPYLTPAVGLIEASRWSYLDGDHWSVLAESLSEWDENKVLHLQRSLTVEVEQMRAVTRIQHGAFVLTVSAIDVSTRMRWLVARSSLDSSIVTLAGSVPGSVLRGNVKIRTTLTVAATSDARAIGAARLPGSILWEHEHSLLIGSSDSYFPVHDTDFSYTQLPVEASWFLESSEDLEAPFQGGFLLLLNNRDKDLMKAVARSSRDGRSNPLLDDLDGGVLELLLRLSLAHETELGSRDDWPTASTGEVLKKVLTAARTRGFSMIYPVSHGDTALFEAAIVSVVREMGKGRQIG